MASTVSAVENRKKAMLERLEAFRVEAAMEKQQHHHFR